MAGVANNWPKALVVVALIVCAARGGLAQSTQVGSRTGKLTDL